MEEVVKKFGWKRNFDYIKVQFFIMWRSLIEYKANFFSMFIDQVFYILIEITFFYVIATNFGDVIGWNFNDFILFMLFIDLIRVTQGIFFWGKRVSDHLISGSFNNHLSRPLNPVFKFFFNDINSSALFYFITDIILIIIVVSMFEVNLNYFNLIIIGSLLLIFEVSFNLFYQSFGFVRLKLEEVLDNIIRPFYWVLNQYPVQFFTNSRITYFFMYLPIFYISSLLIPVIRGYDIWNFSLQIITILSLIIIFLLITINNWKIGLKKYEAFG